MALDIDVSQMQIDLYQEMEIRRNADSDLNDKITAVETEVVNSRTSPTQSYATLPNRLDDMENRLSTVELGGGSGGGDVSALRNYIDQQDAKKADVSHTHSASDVTGGTLSVARGGTGKSSITLNNLIVGNGTSTPKEIAPKQGALYATSTSAVPAFGALPINCGGTGATTAAAARTALGLSAISTATTVPIANGGTGATTAAAARTNLGFTTPSWTKLSGTLPTSSNNPNGIAYCKVANIVFVRIDSGGDWGYAANTNSTIGTLPSGYRPNVVLSFPMGYKGATVDGTVRIAPSGAITTSASGNTKYWETTCVFAV